MNEPSKITLREALDRGKLDRFIDEREDQEPADCEAFEAIQKERELHAGDMAALKSWADVKWADALLRTKAVSYSPSDNP